MNTEQKARELLQDIESPTDEMTTISIVNRSHKIITALLAENQELLMHVHRLLFIAKHAQKYLEKLEEQNNE